MALHVKYRPADFDEVIGHETVVGSIRKALGKDPTPHAYMFTGPSGIGKTTLARIMAKHLQVTKAGLTEINIANMRGIDDIRAIAQQALFRAPGSKNNLYILDECHQMTREGQNAILKVLEDPPDHAYFILCTTDPSKMLTTIRTRCLEYKFEPLAEQQILELLLFVAAQEDIKYSDPVMMEIERSSFGSPRMALNLLAKVEACALDFSKAKKLIDANLAGEASEPQMDIAIKLVDMIYGQRKPRWPEVVKYLQEKVLSRKAPVDDLKRAMIGVLGRKILRTPVASAADIVLEMERGVFGPNTEGALIALVYKLWANGTQTKTVESSSSTTPKSYGRGQSSSQSGIED